MRKRARMVTVVWVALMTVVLASCQAAPPPPTVPPTSSTPATGCHVGLLGDSLSVRIQARLPAALARQRCSQVWVDAAVGRNTAQGVVALAERRVAGELPAVLVVGLGTNDQSQRAAFGGHVDDIMHLSAGRPVVWIEIAHAPIKDELNAVLRRSEIPDDTRKKLVFDKLVINLDSYELTVDGKQVDTPPKELELLYHLAATPNRVYTRNQLLDEVWGTRHIDQNIVDQYVRYVRRKLEAAGATASMTRFRAASTWARRSRRCAR